MPDNHQSVGHEHRYSAFGGLPFAVLSEVEAPLEQKLSELGIHDAEQLVGMAAVEGVLGNLVEHTGLSSAQVNKALSIARESLPSTTVALLSEPYPPDIFPLGALEPTDHSRQAAYEMAEAPAAEAPAAEAPVSLPSSVNHAPSMQPIQNQGRRGTCVAFSTTALHEYYSTVAGANLKSSEQFLYEETKRIDGHPEQCGTWVAYAVRVLANLGQCRALVWPYTPNLPCNHNGTEPANARADATKYRCQPTMIANPRDVAAIKAALAANSNVAFSIPVYNSWDRSKATAISGRITMRLGNEPSVGGHSMCLLAYQDDPNSPGGGYFILRNSWGNVFGQRCPYGVGNGTIPYQYIANDAWEAGYVKPAALPQRGDFEERHVPATGGATIIIETGGRMNIVIR